MSNNALDANTPLRLKRLAGDAVLWTQNFLTRVGEFLDWEWLVYNPLVYLGFERAARRNAPAMVQAIQHGFPLARRMIDVGCGTGTFLTSFRQAGFDVVGVEYSARLRTRCARKGLLVHPFDLSQGSLPPPGAPFDLALSTEVAEHIPSQYADAMVAYLCQLSDDIVFTAAPPGQGGTGHVNEQPRQYWIEKFAAHGMILNEPATDAMAGLLQSSQALKYLHGNLSVFRRQDASATGLANKARAPQEHA